MVTTPQRTFPTPDQVDAWLNSNADPSRISVARADQLDAAAVEAWTQARTSMIQAMSEGAALWAQIDADLAPGGTWCQGVRMAAQMLLGTQSVGLNALCPHVGEARPITVMCDPPVVACATCFPAVRPAIRRMPFLWDQVCDACGRSTDVIHATMVQLGHIVIHGHVCAACHDESRDDAIRNSDAIVPVGRNRPCVCGSGRKYKRCHGRAA